MSAAKRQLNNLPEDPAKLKDIIHQLSDRVHALEEYIRLERLRQFAARSEKSSTDQYELFNEAELCEIAEEGLAEQESASSENELTAEQNTPRPGRKRLAADLPRVRIEHDLPDEQKHCPCGCERTFIGEDTSEQLDIIPAQVRVLVHVRKKYACRHCEEGVQTAPLPPQPIPKSNASAGLLAHVVIAKYQDALPLHRQEAILNRYGAQVPRNTLASWMIKAGQLVQPIINVLNERLLEHPILQMDETRVQVLNEQGRAATSDSQMWVRVGGPPTQPIKLFHYAASRSGAVASDLLEGYEGYLQSDDYAGYNAVGAKADITHLGCWAHARRKFVEAQKAGAKGKTGKADVAISLIAKLYAIEHNIKGQGAEAKCEIRQVQSVPQLEKIRQWLDKTLHSTLPKGLLGRALSYLDKNWTKLTVYTQDGRLSIDNNGAENAIRPFVVGRKNWLFSASVQGAKASANLYSLIETAKGNGQEPYAYLRHLFAALPGAASSEDIDALLPWNAQVQDGVS